MQRGGICAFSSQLQLCVYRTPLDSQINTPPTPIYTHQHRVEGSFFKDYNGDGDDPSHLVDIEQTGVLEGRQKSGNRFLSIGTIQAHYH